MELTIAERFVLLNMLPQQGDITTVKIVRRLREALSFSEQEHVDYEIHTEPDGNGRAFFRWNPSKSGAVKDVEIVGVGETGCRSSPTHGAGKESHREPRDSVG